MCIVTKSSLIERDLDILGPMAAEGLANVTITVTSLDPDLVRKLEPRASAPYRRLQTVARLSESGVPARVLMAPVIPFLNDKDMERILEAAHEAGACGAGYVILRLPHELKGLFKDWLERHYPMRAAHVMGRIRDMRGGREYDSSFGARMSGEGEYAKLLERRFRIACERLGINESESRELRTDKFKPRGGAQGTLF